GEWCLAIEPFKAMRRKMFFRDPLENLPGAVRVELRCIEARDGPNPTFFRAQSAPEIFAADSDAGDRSDAGDDGATFSHGFGVEALRLPDFRDTSSSSAAFCSRPDG